MGMGGMDISILVSMAINAAANAIMQALFHSDSVLAGLIDGQHRWILDAIVSELDLLSDDHDALESEIIARVNGNTTAVGAINRQAIADISAEIVASDKANTAAISKISQDLDAGVSGIWSGIEKLVDVIRGEADQQVIVNNLIDESLITAVSDEMEQVVSAAINAMEDQTTIFQRIMDGALDVLFYKIQEDDVLFSGHMKDLITVVGDIVGAIGAQVSKADIEGDDNIVDVIVNTVFDNVAGPVGVAAEDLAGIFRHFDPRNPASFGTLCDPYNPESDPTKDLGWQDAFINGILAVIEVAVAPMMMAAQHVQICLQNDGVIHPWAIMGAGDVANAWHRNLIDDDQAELELQKAGFDIGRARTLLETTATIPTIDLLFSQWWRGLIDDSALEYELGSLGYSDARIELLKQTFWFIPPVQDLITMAVREVFSPEVREANRQDEDFPQEFSKWAKQQGVTEQWAKDYWAAHWMLPSVQMGYEMLHRGVITPDELKRLMRALDIMPGWRDQLVEISYTPFTRVDIRRMHALGVLSDTEVDRAYRDIGYSPEKAALQLEFVKRLNEPDDLLSLNVASDLTRGSILTFYKRGIIDDVAAIALMLQAGINAGAAALFIKNADWETEIRQRNDEIGLVLDRFKVEEISFSEAKRQLDSIGLAPIELEEAKLDLERLRIGRVKTPSKADLDKFFKADMIDANTYTDELQMKGYSAEWSLMYLNLLAV